MKGLNKVMLIGNLGKDPEIQTLEGGYAIAKFSLATSESYRDKTEYSKQKPNGTISSPGADWLKWLQNISKKVVPSM
jgi:single stranded DNA-binding protein